MWVKSSYIGNQLIFWAIYVLAFYEKYTFDLLKINHTATYVGKKVLYWQSANSMGYLCLGILWEVHIWFDL